MTAAGGRMDAKELNLDGLSLVRQLPEPPGLYIRSRREDKAPLFELLASGTTNMSGIVFDPTRAQQDKEVRDLVLQHYLDAVLDPKTQQLATPFGFSDALASLPWGGTKIQVVEDFIGQNAKRRIAALVEFAVKHHFTAVIAPTHLIKDSSDPWLTVDVDAAKRLRDELARRDAKIAIFYSLSLPYSVLRDPEEREALIRALEDVPMDQLWLKVDGLGNNATHAGVTNYMEACRDFHSLGISILADHFGGYTGLALVATGAVTGLCHAVTVAEQFDSAFWLKPRNGDIYSLRTRAYVSKLDLNLDVKIAKAVIERNAKNRALFACHDRTCCERGLTDMLEKPGKHFVYQRMQQIGSLGRVPFSVRTSEFVDNELRQLTEDLIKATGLDLGDAPLTKRLLAQRRRLDALRVMLSKQLSKGTKRTAAPSLATRRAREAGIR